MDPIQYLLDINNSIPIISYAGKTAGTIHLRTRSWIDSVDTQPSYISVDKEVVLSDHINHVCMIKIHFDSMRHLPKHLCSSTYAYFKFFFHAQPYRTPRYCGTAVNPELGYTVSIEQKITRDFIDFIKSGCLEIEVIRFCKMSAFPSV